MKYMVVAILVIGVGVIVYFVFRKRSTSETEIVFVPASVSQKRVSELGLLQNPRHDAGILRVNAIRFPPMKETADNENYRGSPEIEWIVDVLPPKNFKFQKDKFMEVFDYAWNSNYASQFYAHFPNTNRWSFAIYGDSPEEFDSLELAVELAGPFDEEELTVGKLESYLRELKLRLKKFDVSFEVVPRESPQQAYYRSVALKKFQNELESEVVVVLKSDTHFKSAELWNTLVDAGMKWGDGDLFHWENSENDIGDDHFFSVWTSTQPGYFLPEDIAANTFKANDLIFGFSIPRSADPERVFEMMIAAMEYCQQKLGGVLIDDQGNPFHKAKYENRIRQVLLKMSEHKLEPGQGVSLRLF